MRSDTGKTPFQIAVYGKGGIGKSTVSANLSAALAKSGRKVLQIGCDPKHDSTRLLLHGESYATVLEYLRDVDQDQARVEEILHRGAFDTGCIEAGGPRPGVGCAGRGIISAFEFLDKHHTKEQFDIVLYDVLGDVVCGGFAVPVRREYADAVFLVTSGEFMAIYAANNILRGIRNFDGDRYARVAGIIYNERKIEGEDLRIRRFSEAVRLPVIARVPRSDAFAVSEANNRTLAELTEDPAFTRYRPEQAIFDRLAASVSPSMALYPANPLTDEELEHCILHEEREEKKKFRLAGRKETSDGREEALDRRQTPAPKENVLPDPADRPDKKPARRQPLYGCAFTGASSTAIHLTDAVVIAHSPKACAFYTWQNISSPGRRNLFNRGILLPSAINPNYRCTDMEQAHVVYGGIDLLREHVAAALSEKPGAVIVISSCVSGIIGDDVLSVEELSTPEIPVIVIPADGDINGDYMQGIGMCLHKIADCLFDRTLPRKENCVNLVGETGIANNSTLNYHCIRDMLHELDIGINCRFLGDATVEEVRHFLAAPLCIMTEDNPDNRQLTGWLTESYGCEFLGLSLPIGFRETAHFFREIGARFDRREAVEAMILKEEKNYQERIRRLRKTLAGKKILITTININLDWLLSSIEDVGMEIVWIGVLNYLHQDVKISEQPGRYTLEENLDFSVVDDRIREYKPDLVLSNYTSVVNPGDYIIDTMAMSQMVGFHSAAYVLERWAKLFQNQQEGGWKNDRVFFEQYFR